MPVSSRRQLLRNLMLARETSAEKFNEVLSRSKEFSSLVTYILTENKRFADKYGIGKKKRYISIPSSDEEVWKDYFENHSFSTLNDLRNFCDAMFIITKIDMTKFISVDGKLSRFDPGVCVVPLGNVGAHNYDIGSPCLCISQGTSLHRMNGTTGNSLNPAIEKFRMASKAEITTYLISAMYISGSLMEYLFMTYVNESGDPANSIITQDHSIFDDSEAPSVISIDYSAQEGYTLEELQDPGDEEDPDEEDNGDEEEENTENE